jgi:hypothetical protein
VIVEILLVILLRYFHACRELLRGPLYYVLVLILCALVFWRESPVGVISLAMMCGGDGNTCPPSSAMPNSFQSLTFNLTACRYC